ncbi:MAG: methyltransferase domain-containing protein [Chloroflexota bacterium]
MSQADRERWNERYRGRWGEQEFKPISWLAEIGGLIRPAHAGARALDLACGIGRNGLYLAELGYHVDAWDVSDEGLALLGAELARRGETGVMPRLVDLDEAEIPTGAYDLVLNAFFLDRRLFPSIRDSLVPGGLFAFETFVEGGSRHGAVAPEHLLNNADLLAAFSGFETLVLDTESGRGTTRYLGRKARGGPGA